MSLVESGRGDSHVEVTLYRVLMYLFTVSVICISCSPTGPGSEAGRIAFIGGDGTTGTLTLFVGGADGSGATPVAEGLPDFVDLAWAPNGSSLLFATNFGGTSQFEIFSVPSGGGARHVLAPDGRMPSWSPDGSKIAFVTLTLATQRFDIFTMQADGSGMRAVTETSGNEFSPVWSPDGSQIAYESGSGGRDIYVMEADGSNPRRLTNSGAAAVGAPTWSPDGNLIAFNATIHQTESGFGQFEIYVMANDGTRVRRVTHLSGVRRALRFPT